MQETDLRADKVWKDFRWVMWFLVIAVTAESLVRVFELWHKFDHLKQFGAVVFVMLLLVFPWMLLVGLRKGSLRTEQLVMFTYLLLMMAGSVFGR